MITHQLITHTPDSATLYNTEQDLGCELTPVLEDLQYFNLFHAIL